MAECPAARPGGHRRTADRILRPMMNASPRIADARLSIDPAAAQALAQGRVGDPFSVLGPHATPGGCIIRAYLPGAQAVEALGSDGSVLAQLVPVAPAGL